MKRLAAALAVPALLLAFPLTGLQEGGPASQVWSQSIPLFVFHAQGRSPALVLLRQGERQEGVPRVYYSSRDGWSVAEFSEGLRKATWVAAGRSPSGTDVWAVAQEEDSGYLVILGSNNSGRSWRQRGSLRKISKLANVVYLGMNRDGRGSLILNLEDDPNPEAPRLGHYLYLTENGGKSWTDPIYSEARPSPPVSDLEAPAETYPQDAAPDAALWQRLLASLQTGG
jgi:hypothetical protein